MTVRRKLWVSVAALAALAGCAITVTPSSFDSQAGGAADDSDAAAPTQNISGGATDGAIPHVDAGGLAVTGNPLCRFKYGNNICNPQNENDGRDGGSTATTECLSVLDLNRTDGGDAGQFACHVSKVDGNVQPICLPEGTSQSECVAQGSCSAGYECVGDLTAECRRYCCDPTACDSASFCDIQPIFKSSDVLVPVCMPIAQCKLLSDSCPEQTCTVVDPSKGVTSCVAIGPRTVGEECDTDHCAKDLICLGTIGARKCFKLCDTTSPASVQCPMGQHCRTNSVTFKNADVGICDQ